MVSVTPVDTYTNDPSMSGRFERGGSPTSWAAILAGGVAAAAIASLLLFLGAGLGLTAASPWANGENVKETIGIGAIIWSFVIQLVAFGVGGYLAGRLRTKWASIHKDESYFRDTAHGFLAWAFGSLVGLYLLASVVGHLGHGAAAAAAQGASGIAGLAKGVSQSVAASDRGNNDPMGYFVDLMLRPTSAGNSSNGQGTSGVPTPAGTSGGSPGGSDGQTRAEVTRILMTSLFSGSTSQVDKDYLGQMVASRTGLSQQDAAKRVDDTINQVHAAIQQATDKAKEMADTARKAAITLTLWTFAAMIAGAFAAAYAALVGGRARDAH